MIWHVFGWTTVAAQALAGASVARWLWTTSTRPWSWQQKLPVPELQDEAVLVGYSSDVGLV